MDPGDPGNPADPLRGLAPQLRALIGDRRAFTVELARAHRRLATPRRSARPADVTIAAAPGGIWLDVRDRAGVLFSPDEWAQLVVEAALLLVDTSRIVNHES